MAPEQPLVVAHRGASGDAPENTGAAFREAMAAGADLIETDVRLSADGVPVLVHDSTLTRTTDVRDRYPGRAPYRVGEFTLAELRRLDAGSWYGEDFRGEPVPTLAELLDLVGTDVGLLLELKRPGEHPGLLPAVADVLDRCRLRGTGGREAVARGGIVVGSIDRDAARAYKALRPDATVGALIVPPDTPDEELAAIAGYADLAGTGAGLFDESDVDRFHDKGLLTFSNTSTLAHMRTMAARGVDGTVSDYPGRMVAQGPGGAGIHVEAEALLPARRTSAELAVAGNRGLGGGKLSGDAAVVLRAAEVGDSCTLAFDVPAGRYTLSSVVLGGPAFGTCGLDLDGRPLGSAVDAYRPSPVRLTLRHGAPWLDSGEHLLTLRVVGRNPAAAGWRAGLDLLVLEPVSAEEPVPASGRGRAAG